MKSMFIYGIYDLSGICHYVGQTKDVENRRDNHLRKIGRFNTAKFNFRIIRSCMPEHADRLEHQVFMAYFLKGEAVETKAVRLLPNLRRFKISESQARLLDWSLTDARLAKNIGCGQLAIKEFRRRLKMPRPQRRWAGHKFQRTPEQPLLFSI